MSAFAPNAAVADDVAVYRLTLDAYHRMIEAGIFGEDDHVELIDGELRVMPPINPGHAGKNNRLIGLFSARIGNHAVIANQNPLPLPEHSEPEPDLMLLRPREDFYESSHPRPEDVLLLVEVADSSRRFDGEVKVPLYARHAIAEVWLLDLKQQRLEVYRDPGPEGYRQVLLPDRSQSVAPLLLPDVEIAVAELW